MSAENKKANVRKRYIKYHRTLVCYDGVQLFLALGPRDRLFICVAVPTDSNDEIFLCAPISTESLSSYLAESIDLLALLKSTTTNRFYSINFSLETGKGFLLNELLSVPKEWLPDRHVFARCHTEDFELPMAAVPSLDTCKRKIHIDGRWDAQDLADLPDLFTDNYSFLYALTSDEFVRNPQTQDMFLKFPWRGGFSTVGFYQGLYQQVPRPHRLGITGMEYHSPGEIEVSAVDGIFDQISNMSAAFSENKRDLQRLYRQLYESLSSRKLLGRSVDEIAPTALDLDYVQRYTSELAEGMRFGLVDQLVSLSDNNWISAAKILMSFYRRMKALADFFDSGKASFT